MSCQLIYLLYEWLIHVIATSIRKVHDINVVVEHEVECIQEPRRKRLPTFRENFENIYLCIRGYSRAILMNRSNNACNESAVTDPVFCIWIMRKINYFHHSQIGMFIWIIRWRRFLGLLLFHNTIVARILAIRYSYLAVVRILKHLQVVKVLNFLLLFYLILMLFKFTVFLKILAGKAWVKNGDLNTFAGDVPLMILC